MDTPPIYSVLELAVLGDFGRSAFACIFPFTVCTNGLHVISALRPGRQKKRIVGSLFIAEAFALLVA